MGKQTAGASPAPPGHDPLAIFRRADDPRLVDWLKVGAAEQGRRTHRRVPQAEIDALDWLHANGGTFYVAAAAADYATWLTQHAVVVSTRIRIKNGRLTTTTRRYAPSRRASHYWFSSVGKTRPRAPINTAPVTPRTRAREHQPGSTRRASSSSRSSGQDPSSDESDLPASRRCAAPWCNRLVVGSAQKRYCGHERCDLARAEERQRKHRTGDLTALEREDLEDARLAHYIGAEAFAAPNEHSLSFLWRFGLVAGDDPGELEALLNRPACRCNGHHIDGGAVGCFKCGLVREAVVSCS